VGSSRRQWPPLLRLRTEKPRAAVEGTGSKMLMTAVASVRNNHVMDMSLCHGGVLVEHECVCESRRVRVCRVGACRTIVESGREREFLPPQLLVVWG
jgi:hypothetical protein